MPEKFKFELPSPISECEGGCFFEAVYDFGEFCTLTLLKGLLPRACVISVFIVLKLWVGTSEL